MKETIVMGIDPGYGRTGFAVITQKKKPEVLYSDCFETSSDMPFEERVYGVVFQMSSLIKKYNPSHVSVEKIFFYKNKKTAIDVAGVRGALLCCAVEKNIPVTEYTPKQIKISVTGDGGADKDQVKKMVYLLTDLEKEKRLDDEIDAIAIGLTHLAQNTIYQ